MKIAPCILIALFAYQLAFSQTTNAVLVKRTIIPKEYLGHWQKGTFSLTNFEDINGKYVGPANENSVSYVLAEDGKVKEYFISNTNSYNCRMEILGYREGQAVFNSSDNSYQFQPTSGYYTTLSCMNKTGSKKEYTTHDLYPAYTMKLYFMKDDKGLTIVITKKADGSEGLRFRKID